MRKKCLRNAKPVGVVCLKFHGQTMTFTDGSQIIKLIKNFPLMAVAVRYTRIPRKRVKEFNDMQMIFSALSGSSGQVPVTPIGGNRMYCALWE